jgi:hypothetical protein
MPNAYYFLRRFQQATTPSCTASDFAVQVSSAVQLRAFPSYRP